MNTIALKRALKMNKQDITDAIISSPYLMVVYAFYSLTTGHGIMYTLMWSIVMGLIAGLWITVVIRYLILTRYAK